jgi:hypothetical protein
LARLQSRAVSFHEIVGPVPSKEAEVVRHQRARDGRVLDQCRALGLKNAGKAAQLALLAWSVVASLTDSAANPQTPARMGYLSYTSLDAAFRAKKT